MSKKSHGCVGKCARAEVERYVVWPGQALGYKIGMLEIQRLRREAESAVGERFDVCAFHDEVLSDNPPRREVHFPAVAGQGCRG